jgi:hypothetical protein
VISSTPPVGAAYLNSNVNGGMMPFSVAPTTFDIPAVKQDVKFHIWGKIQSGTFTDVRRTLTSLEVSIGVPFDHLAAMRPGGALLREVQWGDMPSGLGIILAGYGLSVAWFTQPTGFEVRGSYLSHAQLDVAYSVRIDPAWGSIDLIRPIGFKSNHPERIASSLFHLSPRLGVPEAMSNHNKLSIERTLEAAQNAQTVEQLEVVAGGRRKRSLLQRCFRAIGSHDV